MTVVPVAAGLLLILLSNLLGVEFQPAPIVCTLFLLPLIIAGLNYPLYQYNFSLTVIYNYGLLIVNDLMIRTYSDTLNKEQQEWIASTFLATFAISLFIMTVLAFTTSRKVRQGWTLCVTGRCLTVIVLGMATAIGYYYFISPFLT